MAISSTEESIRLFLRALLLTNLTTLPIYTHDTPQSLEALSFLCSHWDSGLTGRYLMIQQAAVMTGHQVHTAI